jgi:hypothetical protein
VRQHRKRKRGGDELLPARAKQQQEEHIDDSNGEDMRRSLKTASHVQFKIFLALLCIEWN